MANTKKVFERIVEDVEDQRENWSPIDWGFSHHDMHGLAKALEEASLEEIRQFAHKLKTTTKKSWPNNSE